MAALQNETSIIQKDINKINDIISSTREVNYHESPDMLNFLIKFRQMAENIETCISKQLRGKLFMFIITASFSIKTDDYPRELEERKKKLFKYEKLKKLIRVKDEIIWNLVNDPSIKNDKNINERTQIEVSQWAKYINF